MGCISSASFFITYFLYEIIRGGSTAVKCVMGRAKLLKITGGVTTVMAVLIKKKP